MKAGWRVRRAHARRRERLLQDFTGFPVQAGPGAGPGSEGQKGQQTCGLVQVVRVDRAPEPLQMETRTDARDAGGMAPEKDAQEVCSLHGLQKCLDHLDHPDQASSGAVSSRSALASCGGPCGPALRPWRDDRGWITDIIAAEPGDPKLAALFWWVIAAGGWIEGWTAKLPAMPASLARNELHRMLRRYGIAVEEAAP